MKASQKIYLVGNELVNKDSMPFKIAGHLKKALPEIQFINFDPTENFPENPSPIFIDTAINAKEPRVCTSVDEFQPEASKNVSVHGFDFYAELALRKKLGKYSDCFIICVPPDGDIKKIAEQAVRIIKKSIR